MWPGATVRRLGAHREGVCPQTDRLSQPSRPTEAFPDCRTSAAQIGLAARGRSPTSPKRKASLCRFRAPWARFFRRPVYGYPTMGQNEPAASATGKAPKSLYGSRWRRYRLSHLQRNPLCSMCLPLGRITPATVVDHIKRHHGHDDPLFWDQRNFQSLCKPCHDAIKQAIDRSGWARGYDEQGLPLFDDHRRR